MKTSKILQTGSLCILYALVLTGYATAQDNSNIDDRVLSVPDYMLKAIDKKVAGIDVKMSRQTERYLQKLGRQEQRLKRKLMKKDATLAAQVFGEVDKRYAKLKAMSGAVGKYSEVYSGRLDSLRTGIKFLQEDKYSGLVNNASLQSSLERLNGLQERFNQTDQISRYLSQRESQLKEGLGRLGMLKEMKRFRKDVYYYQAQAKEYKAMFEDPDKVEQKVMAMVRRVPQFQEFFSSHSQLAGLFAMPGSSGINTAAAGMQGMQTATSINQVLQERFGSNNGVVKEALQQGAGGAQANPLSLIRDKVSGYGSGQAGNAKSEVGSVPDFKPNNQKTRSFLKRLEVGTNLQSQKARSFFPVTTDIGLSVGYKLNDRSVAGIGGSYKMGLGSNWNKIRVTHQGVGVRSYVDYKIKGAIYLSGGYEQNYRVGFSAIAQLKDYGAWQSSGLIGISKRYAVGRKMKGDMKVLWDFLSYQQTPKNQPILFRLGYSIK